MKSIDNIQIKITFYEKLTTKYYTKAPIFIPCNWLLSIHIHSHKELTTKNEQKNKKNRENFTV